MDLDIRKVEQIAHQVRGELDVWWPNQHEENSTDLCGCCVIGSTKLMLELQKNGFDCSISITESHGYVELGKYIVDITATQFNFSEPVLIKPKTFFSKSFKNFIIDQAYNHSSKKTYKTYDEVASHQLESGWISEQSVLTFESFVKGDSFSQSDSWGADSWGEYCSVHPSIQLA